MIQSVMLEDERALHILYRGREWVIVYLNGEYRAVPHNNQPVTQPELIKLFAYLKAEAFINNDGSPAEPAQTQ